MFDKNIMKLALTNSVGTITFEKADGTIREMRCTLMPKYLPAQKQVEENVSPRKENDAVLSVWDLDKDGWRSFRLDSVRDVSFEIGELNAASA